MAKPTSKKQISKSAHYLPRRKKVPLRNKKIIGVWTKKNISLLGKHSDSEVGRRLGRTQVSVCIKRNRLGIPPWRTYPAWTAAEIALFGKISDRQVARRTGRTKGQVSYARVKRGIHNLVNRKWTAAEEKQLGTDTDRALA